MQLDDATKDSGIAVVVSLAIKEKKEEKKKKQAREARRWDSYLHIWNYQSLTDSLTHWLTGVTAGRRYRI